MTEVRCLLILSDYWRVGDSQNVYIGGRGFLKLFEQFARLNGSPRAMISSHSFFGIFNNNYLNDK